MRTFFKLSTGLIVMACLIACNEEGDLNPSENPGESPSLPVIVRINEDLFVSEDAETSNILIDFDKPATTDGKLLIGLTTHFQDDFLTEPPVRNDTIELSVSKDDEFALFTFRPVNNSIPNSNKTIIFEIMDATEDFTIDTENHMTVTIVDDEAPITVDFVNEATTIQENDEQGITFTLSLSDAAYEAATITLEVEGNHNGLFTTYPQLNEHDQLTLDVPVGATEASFSLIPTNNNQLNGHQSFRFVIKATSESIRYGSKLTADLTIVDDELNTRAKSYETAGGGWASRKTYEYDDQGRVSKVHWETETPFLSTGTDTYYYNDHGRLERINHYPGHDVYYYWENNKLVRSETMKNDEKTAYTLFDYDEAGNVGAEIAYHLQSSGEFVASYYHLHLYFTDGNLYKTLIYYPVNGSLQELQLISSRTFDNYLTIFNPFPVEIIPTIAAQNKLPGTYRIEENGADLLYNFSYTYNEQGLPVSRNVSGAGVESTTYSYY